MDWLTQKHTLDLWLQILLHNPASLFSLSLSVSLALQIPLKHANVDVGSVGVFERPSCKL